MKTATSYSTLAAQKLTNTYSTGKKQVQSLASSIISFFGWVVKVCDPRNCSYFQKGTPTAGQTSLLDRTVADLQVCSEMYSLLRGFKMNPSDMIEFLKMVSSDD